MAETLTEAGEVRSGQSSAAAHPMLPRRRFFNDMPDRGLFAACAFAGAALIIVLKLSHVNAEMVAVLAGALMIGYGIIAFRLPAVQLRLDRLGDNFYYLGFIFTLASMSAALLQLRRGADIEALLGSFGIALFTTIIGVAGRVLFVQMRGEIDEVEATVRRDLLEASADLKAQLSLALREFETFQVGVRQAANEAASDSNKLVEAQIEGIRAVARVAAERTKEMFDAHQPQAQGLAELILGTAKLVKQISEDLRALELPTDKFEHQLSTISNSLESAVSRIHRIIQQMEVAVGLKRSGIRRFWPFRH